MDGLMKRLLCILGLVLLAACVTTQYGKIPASQLTDDQLIGDLISVYSKLGILQQRMGLLAAIRPQPSYVLRGSTISTASGSAYVSGNNIYGSAMASSQSTYWLEDQTAMARAVNTVLMVTQQLNYEMIENRRVALETEAYRRIHDREYNNKRIVASFWAQNPDLQNEQLLIGCVTPWVQKLNPDDDLEHVLPLVAENARGFIKRRSQPGYSGLWVGVFSEKVTLADGQKGDWVDYISVQISGDGDKITGEGLLYTGPKFTIQGTLDGDKLIGKVINTTPGYEWDADFSLAASPTKIAGTYYGKAVNATYEGSVTFIR
jgi:hypothetical protein